MGVGLSFKNPVPPIPMNDTAYQESIPKPETRKAELTDTAIRNAKPTNKQWKLYDKKGLFVLVHPNGSKYWRMKYRFSGKEKMLSLGVYPDVSLKAARESRDDARKA